jgi:hypothetical protein
VGKDLAAARLAHPTARTRGPQPLQRDLLRTSAATLIYDAFNTLPMRR